MENVKRVVIPVDNSESSKNVVRQGAFLAKALGIKATVISINDTHQFIASVVLEEKLKKEAEAFLESFKPIGKEMGVDLQTILISGDPAEEIVNYSNEDDLIIMAGHKEKKGRIDRFILGSTPEEVLRHAPCSVLMLKSK